MGSKVTCKKKCQYYSVLHRGFYLLLTIHFRLISRTCSASSILGLAVVCRIPRAGKATALKTYEGCFTTSICVYDKVTFVVQAASTVVAQPELVFAVFVHGLFFMLMLMLSCFQVRRYGLGCCCPVAMCVHCSHTSLSGVFLLFCLTIITLNTFQFFWKIEEYSNPRTFHYTLLHFYTFTL